MEPKSLQKPNTGAYSEPDEPSQHPPTLFP
jgi:hypothetical protein